MKVGLVTYPWASRGPRQFVLDVSRLVIESTGGLLVLGGDVSPIDGISSSTLFRGLNVRLHYARTKRPYPLSILAWISKSLFIQLITAVEVFRRRRDIEIVFFYMSFPYHFPALFLSRILGLKTVEVVTRSHQESRSLISALLLAMTKIDFMLLDRISLESPSLSSCLPLSGYEFKLTSMGCRFVDTSRFTVRSPLSRRQDVVAFVGRLHREKGVFNFLDSIPLIVKGRDSSVGSEMTFVVCGSGECEQEVRRRVAELSNRIPTSVQFKGWLPHEDMHMLLDETKILVVPSTSEGLPTIILEAMACGVAVLAPPIGGIPDVLCDGKTGYLLRSTNPEEIARSVARVLRDVHMDEVSRNAREIVERNYSYFQAVRRYSDIIEDTRRRGKNER